MLDLDAIRSRLARRNPENRVLSYEMDVDALLAEVERLRAVLKVLYESVMHHSGYWIPDLDMDVGMAIEGLKEAHDALTPPSHATRPERTA
jgi:hypothetical protein